MPDAIYFQWQNEYLLRTIYPLRETKLRDFLVFFHEIELWQQYKDRPALQLAGEIQAYRAARRARVIQAYEQYRLLEAYFLNEDVPAYRAAFLLPDAAVMAQITEVHKSFKRFFPTYKNPAKEKYFISARVRQMEELQKKIRLQISEKQRILRNNGPAWANKTSFENEVRRLETISLKMVEQELSQLVAFMGAYERLYQYKVGALQQKAAQEKNLQDGAGKQQALRIEMETLQAKQAAVQAALHRLKNPPDAQALKAYFMDEDVSDRYIQRAGDPAVLKVINEAHRAFKLFFPTYNNAVKERFFISQRLSDINRLRGLKQQELSTAARLGSSAKAAALKQVLLVLDEELGKLTDLQWVYDSAGKPAGAFSGQIAQAEKEQVEIQNKIRAAQAALAAQETALAQAQAALNASEQDLILASVDAAEVKVQDIARDKAEEYKNSLLQKDHRQLLEDVAAEFLRSPTRYPLWLQYMVVHFSGMRYQSAHGSWADPKDLLLSLRMRSIEHNLKRAGEDAIRAMCEERYALYQSARQAPGADAAEQAAAPALARAADPAWKRRVEHHIRALDPASGYNKTKALLDVQIDEEDYEIQQLSDAQALAGLEGMKDQIPDWMWNEIVRTTNLRLTQVKQAGWEQLTAEEREQRYAAGMAPYREILEKWKREHLTAWREAHDRSSQLIVTRAVCNEVAEHIQHIRGRTPSGGLTAKPEWYLRCEKDPRLARVPDKPYLVKPKTAADFRPGASILWLSWVHKEPNIWQIARPIVLRSGEELIPAGRDAQNEITNTGSAFVRRVRFAEKGPDGRTYERQSQQWLRWNHEATVVEVTETADGPVVLTFETALPGEDRRQSTIGVFKRYLSDLKHNVSPAQMNGTFVGYVPEGAVPYDDLHDMLDWNRVLLRDACTPAEMAQYWQKVTRPIDPAIAFDAPGAHPQTQVEIAPRLKGEGHEEWAACREYDLITRSITLYRPAVELRRGARLHVSKEQAVQANGETCYMVTRCDGEPRAEGLYLRADEVMDVPEGTTTRVLQARRGGAFYRLLGADQRMRPIFEKAPLQPRSRTQLVVSTVHKAGPRDPGDGSVRGQGSQRYALVIACPDLPEAEGLFIRWRGEARSSPG